MTVGVDESMSMLTHPHDNDDARPLREAYRQLEIELETARRCHPHLNARIEELSGELAALARRIAWLSDDAPDRDT